MRLSEIMSGAGLSIFPQVGLVIFLAVFVAVVWRVLRHRSTPESARFESLPLDDHPSAPPSAVHEWEGERTS